MESYHNTNDQEEATTQLFKHQYTSLKIFIIGKKIFVFIV